MPNLPPLAVFTAFVIGLEAIVGLSLGLSDGLSETHKSVLVTFIVAFPAMTLFLFVSLLPRAERVDAMPFRRHKAELAPEPFRTGAQRA